MRLQTITKRKTERTSAFKGMCAAMLSVFLLFCTVCGQVGMVAVGAEESVPTANEDGDKVQMLSEAAVLAEVTNGTVLLEKNADVQRPIASVTKVMTLLLIFEALESGKIKLTDEVTVSEYAASMGGSQVFLESGETQTVENMIKCISISSANDACVAMAEHLAGSEQEFVKQMNEKAGELEMKNTVFLNCCGLDTEGHVSTARDVAIMSAKLLGDYPEISKYATTWMDSIVHRTRRGDSEFGLSNTNKLIKQYNGITGLKTGSTDKAKYCLSASAQRNGIHLVAVVLAAPDTKTRFREAAALLDYGFAKCTLFRENAKEVVLKDVTVEHGRKKTVSVGLKQTFTYVFTGGEDISTIERKPVFLKHISAPLKKGDKVGEYRYYLSGKEIGSVDIIVTENMEKESFSYGFKKCIDLFFREE